MFYQILTKVKKYFSFTQKELKDFIIVSIIFGFILSFGKWGGEEFDAAAGAANWIRFIIYMMIILFVHISIQKIFALRRGYSFAYNWWYPGILIGFLLTFMTTPITIWLHKSVLIIPASIPFLYPGMMNFKIIKTLKIGNRWTSYRLDEMVQVAVAGIISTTILAVITGLFYVSSNNANTLSFMKTCILFTFFSLLPLPTFVFSNMKNRMKLGEGVTCGTNILYFSRPLYFFIFSSFIIYSILIYSFAAYLSSFVLLIIALILGLLSMIIILRLINDPFSS